MNVHCEKINVRYDDVYFELIRCISTSVESAHFVQL